jgi:hypothetical protein
MNKMNQHWVFGNRAGLDFTNANSTTPPTPTPATSSLMSTGEGCASISDSNGNLLFYTDGITVWDSSNTVRAAGLLGDPSSTQSAIIVPDPGNSNRYYILTMDGSSNSTQPYNHFNGIRIDITTWGVTLLSSLIALPNTLGFSPAEKLTAIQHKNCKDFWVITVLQTLPSPTADGTTTFLLNGLGTFRVFLINSTGITHVADTPMGNNVLIHDLGYLKGSPNGQTLAIANGTNNNVLVFPFDNATGVINTGLLRTITVPTVPAGINRDVYGVEFSPNSNILYYGTLTTGTPAYIFQVDLTVGVLTSTAVGLPIANAGGGYAIGALQLGMDDRIYIAKAGEASLGAILNPNVLGTGCTVNPNYIALPAGTLCVLGLPNLLPNPCDDDCDCGCNGCNDNASAQEQALTQRAKNKFKVIVGSGNGTGCSPAPYSTMPCKPALAVQGLNLCFYLQWGDSLLDQIETHDTETLFLTVCNPYADVKFKGLKITSLIITPGPPPLSQFQIIPDSFICFDCMEPCSCKSRELACITRDVAAGIYTVKIEYCVDEICVATNLHGSTSFAVNVIQD